MTLHAVPLLVARGAALEILASGLPMAQEPYRLGVVIPRSEASDAPEPTLDMAVTTECGRLMAGGALVRSSERHRRVSGDEVRRVVARAGWSIMAVPAVRGRVAGGTAASVGRRERSVRLFEEG